MATPNQLAVIGKKGKNFKDVTAILNNPSDRRKLQQYLDESVVLKTQILDKQTSIKTLRDSAVDELGIEPKMFTSMVSMLFNNNFEEKQSELERMQEAITSLMNHGMGVIKGPVAPTEE